MANESVKVDIVGLRDFQRELRAVNAKMPAELRKIGLRVAQHVADDVRSSFASRGGSAPKVAPSVKALAQQRSAAVQIGGAKYPFALGNEFGGGAHGNGNPTSRGGYTTQFPPYRGHDGYSLYPTIRRNRQRVVDAFGDELAELSARAFPD